MHHFKDKIFSLDFQINVFKTLISIFHKENIEVSQVEYFAENNVLKFPKFIKKKN